MMSNVSFDVRLQRFHRIDQCVESSIRFYVVSDRYPVMLSFEPRDGHKMLLEQAQQKIASQFNHWFRNGIYLAGEESEKTELILSEPLLYFECRCKVELSGVHTKGEAREAIEEYFRIVDWLAKAYHIVYICGSQNDAKSTQNVKVRVNVSKHLDSFAKQLQCDLAHLKKMNYDIETL